LGIGRPLLLSALAVLGLGSLATPSQGVAQGVLLRGEVELRLPPSPGPVEVTSIFVLRPEPGELDVTLSLLNPRGVHLDFQAVEVEGAESIPPERMDPSFQLEEVREHYWEGSVRLPPESELGTDSTFLQVSYIVEGAWVGLETTRGNTEPDRHSGRVTVPVLVPRWVPDDPKPTTFRARVLVPSGLTVTGSFPSSVLREPEAGQEGVYEMALQGAPAMLILRVAQGAGSGLTLEGSLDLVVVLILLGMGLLGIRHLRKDTR
jgi:hypothetical protein